MGNLTHEKQVPRCLRFMHCSSSAMIDFNENSCPFLVGYCGSKDLVIYRMYKFILKDFSESKMWDMSWIEIDKRLLQGGLWIFGIISDGAWVGLISSAPCIIGQLQVRVPDSISLIPELILSGDYSVFRVPNSILFKVLRNDFYTYEVFGIGRWPIETIGTFFYSVFMSIVTRFDPLRHELTCTTS